MCVIWDSQQNGLEDIDRILERIEDASGASRPGPPPLSTKKHVLYVEHRCGRAGEQRAWAVLTRQDLSLALCAWEYSECMTSSAPVPTTDHGLLPS